MYTAYGIVTLYEWSWWSYSTLVERELKHYMNKEICVLSW